MNNEGEAESGSRASSERRIDAVDRNDQPARSIKPYTEFESPLDVCSYLPDEMASLKYQQWLDMDAERYVRYLERGWRRHGVAFFRPNCPACSKCRSLRVDVAGFKPSKSQRRCLKRNSDVEIRVVRPELTQAHIELFDRYHHDMSERRGWPNRSCSPYEYASAFLVGNFEFTFEFQYRRDDALIGVGLVDISDQGASSVYFYHAPEWRPEGPGVFSMLSELRFVAEKRIPFHYLGYWISACPSMAYKSNYGPHEILTKYVSFDETPEWVASSE